MARRLGPRLAVVAALALQAAGCRSVGRFPTIDPTDYATNYFRGFYMQVFHFNAAQVESSTLQALGDLGFTKIEREPLGDGVVKIKCWTLDHRPTCLWVKPRNEAMAQLTIHVGLVGDELVSQTVMERVSLNFGTIPRVMIPMEPTIERRFNPTPPLQPTLPKVVTLPTPAAIAMPLSSMGDEATPSAVPTPPEPGADTGPFVAPEMPIPPPTYPAPTPTGG